MNKTFVSIGVLWKQLVVHLTVATIMAIAGTSLLKASHSVAPVIPAFITPANSGAHVNGVDATDFSDDRKLVGASHYVFVARVIRLTSDRRMAVVPTTEHEVQPILDLKGSLNGPVVVSSFGGPLYVPGTTWLFAVAYDRGKYFVQPSGAISISANPALSDDDLRALARRNDRFSALQKAYPNEILLDLNVKSGTAYNSYASLKSGHLFTPPPFAGTEGSSAPAATTTPEPAVTASPEASASPAEEATASPAPAETVASTAPEATPTETPTPTPTAEPTPEPTPAA